METQKKGLYTYTHIHTHMGTKNIAIMDDVYEMLKARKGKDESFSDIIRKSLKTKKLSDFAGVLPDLEIDLKKVRERANASRRLR